MINLVNLWKSGNKKNKYSLTLDKLTFFEFKICPCNNEGCSKFRFMLLNLGFEL